MFIRAFFVLGNFIFEFYEVSSQIIMVKVTIQVSVSDELTIYYCFGFAQQLHIYMLISRQNKLLTADCRLLII